MTVKRMGDIQQGDVVFSANGERVTVTQVCDRHTPDDQYIDRLIQSENAWAYSMKLADVRTRMSFHPRQSLTCLIIIYGR